MIGEDRHLVALANPGEPVPDGDGGFTESYAPLDPPTWYCTIEPATAAGLERMTAGAVISLATHAISGRYHPGITTETRLTFEGRVFEVKQVINRQERNMRTVLVCVEQVDLADGTVNRRVSRPVAPGGPPMPVPAAAPGSTQQGGLD
jgi:head-tail adaptor